MPDDASERTDEVTQNETPQDAGPRRRLPRVVKYLIGICAILLVAVIASVVMDIYGSRKVAAARAYYEAWTTERGIPVPFVLEGDVWGKPDQIPESTNAATWYQAAFALVRVAPTEKNDKSLPIVGDAALPDDPREALPPEQMEAMRAYLSRSRTILDILCKAAPVETCRFRLDFDGPFTLLPHLSPARASARLLAVGAVTAAEEGHPSDAIHYIADGLAIGRAVRQDPFLISALVASATDAITVETGVTRVLSRTNPSQDDLVRLQALLRTSSDGLSYERAMAGEAALTHAGYARLLDGRCTAGTFASTITGGDIGGPANAWGRARTWFLSGWLKASEAESIERIILFGKGASARAAVPAPSSDPALQADASQSRYMLTRMIVPAVSRALEQAESTRARLRAAEVSVAALRYRNAQGDWPEALSALVPGYIDAVPLDTFTGAELTYRITPEGIVVYSFGPNRADDGGRPSPIPAPKGTSVKPSSYDDVGFRIWKQGSENGHASLEIDIQV